eukprot:11952343-Heterocapsa_arctica.AAC.1
MAIPTWQCEEGVLHGLGLTRPTTGKRLRRMRHRNRCASLSVDVCAPSCEWLGVTVSCSRSLLHTVLSCLLARYCCVACSYVVHDVCYAVAIWASWLPEEQGRPALTVGQAGPIAGG